MKTSFVFLLFLSQVAVSQPLSPVSVDYFATVKERADKKAKSSDWPVYSDSEMNDLVGRLQPGRTVRLTGSVTNGIVVFIVDEKLSGYVTYKALELNGIYWTGMPETAARYSLGDPDKINASNSGLDQWIYKKKDLYLYFSNGVLRSYQNVLR